ncbi:small-subunit processome [Limtongia smithiae]|uniref:small-subunit processome n=1 Tax=Limtongia smithiae TaxID=1125753 RepID=UPI0034CED9F1
MSSLKFSVQKKQHRERAQPKNRSKWGLLEKHKDYVLRARDYHSKEGRLRALRSKARERNPDEFYHGMKSSLAGRPRVAAESENAATMSQDHLRLLKTQDAGYVVTALAHERAQVAALRNKLAFSSLAAEATGEDADNSDEDDDDEYASDYDYSDEEQTMSSTKLGSRSSKKKTSSSAPAHTRFVDSLSEARAAAASQSSSSSTTPALNAKRPKAHARMLRELQDRRERAKKLGEVLDEVQLQRALMAGGSPRKKTVTADGRVVWKWKPQRKR